MIGSSIDYSEQAKIKKRYDVIVVGGGPSGVGAALAARRAGKETLLVEKSAMLGGLATLGLVVLYNPPIDDGKGRKLVGGITEELMHLSVKYSYGSIPPQWTKGTLHAEGKGRYQTVFSAPAFSLALNALLVEEGVHILYDALLSMSIMEGNYCRGIIVTTKAGKFFYPAGAIVDCTGDADVFFYSGAEYLERTDNWLTYWAQSTSLDLMRKAVETGEIRNAIRIEALGAKADGRDNPPGARRYGLQDPEEVSEFVIQGQMIALDRLKELSANEGCMTALPGMPQFRKTRYIKGEYVFSEKDRMTHFEDSVGCVAEEYNKDYLIEIPYRTLISKDCDNIFAAGRVISFEGKPQDTTRLIGISVLTGEAAGTAAAILLDQKCTTGALDVSELQNRLVHNGNLIHF